MLSEKARKCFSDIVRAIQLIEEWTLEAGGVEKALQVESQTRSAIERQLLIISESAVRLHKIDPTLAAAAAPTIDWPGVRGIGNFIRHRYDVLDVSIFAEVLNTKLSN